MGAVSHFTFDRMPDNLQRLRKFVQEMTALVERRGGDEPALLDEGEKLLRALVTTTTGCPRNSPGRRRIPTASTCCTAIRSSASRW